MSGTTHGAWGMEQNKWPFEGAPGNIHSTFPHIPDPYRTVVVSIAAAVVRLNFVEDTFMIQNYKFKTS